MDRVKYVDYVKRASVEAYCDAYAYDEYNIIYLLSVCGQDSAVKAITSALVASKTVEIINNDKAVDVDTGWNNKYKILTTKLECGQLHQLLLIDTFFNTESEEKLIFVEDKANITETIYNQINKTYPVPLIPNWSKWLYNKIELSGSIEELEGNITVIKLNVAEKSLDELISKGVKSGEIGFSQGGDVSDA